MRFVVVAAALLATAASGETLTDAVGAAYQSNPVIAAARAQLRQVDENVPIAQSGGRPSINLTGDFVQQLSNSIGNEGRIWRGGAMLVQPLYQNGRVRAGVSAAEAQVAAAVSRLRVTENQVIVDTVAAYADVLRANSLVALNEGQVKLLTEQLKASRDRFEVGDLTRTDVAQSEARLAAANAQLQAATAQQTLARQAYRRLVGHEPMDLEPLPELPDVPESAEEARTIAFENSPLLAAVRFDERAAQENVRAVKASHGPSVALNSGALYVQGSGASAGLTGFTPSLSVSASMPLFTSGLIAARVRQAQAAQSQAIENISQTERTVRESVTNVFALLQTARSLIESANAQVGANELAAEGVRMENEVGNRNVLDVLNAEQELLTSRVNLVQAERDRFVASFQLLQVAGVLDAAFEGTAIGGYDATANAARVRGKWWQEFGYDPDPAAAGDRNAPETVVGPVP